MYSNMKKMSKNQVFELLNIPHRDYNSKTLFEACGSVPSSSKDKNIIMEIKWRGEARFPCARHIHL